MIQKLTTPPATELGADQPVPQPQSNPSNSGTENWLQTTPLHPYLWGALPILSLYWLNFHAVAFSAAMGPVVWTATAAALITLVLGKLFKNRRKAALATTTFLVFFFTYGLAYKVNTVLAGAGSPILLFDWLLLPIWNVAMLLSIFCIYRNDIDEGKWTRFANLAGLGLVGMIGISLVTTSFNSTAGSNIAEQPNPENAPIVLAGDKEPRDIYYLVFSQYADAATLKHDFEFDNTEFLGKLQEQGFVVADKSRANYPLTELSMASALNMKYLGADLDSITTYQDMLKSHEVGRALTNKGYLYVHLGNPFDGLRRNEQASAIYRFSKMRSEFSEILFKMTPLYSYFPTTDIRTQVTEKFGIATKMAEQKSKTPKFVFGHFLLPHAPWKFKTDGEWLTPGEATELGDKESYLNQIRYTNTQILELVATILKNAEREPIIIIQSDEGPELRFDGDNDLPAEFKVRKRSGILTAVHLPGVEEGTIPQDLTPANTFRFVFNQYFGTKLDLLETRHFFFRPTTPQGKPDFSKVGQLVDITKVMSETEWGQPLPREQDDAVAAETSAATSTDSTDGPSQTGNSLEPALETADTTES